MALLRKVFSESYLLNEKEYEPVKAQVSGAVQNPHEPQAQYSAKGVGQAKKQWVGYKVQVAESIGEREEEKAPKKNFLTSIVTQSAIESDDAGLPGTMEKQKEMGLEAPSELYVDGAYISAAALALAEKEGRELLGPAQPSPHKENIFGAEEFDVDVAARRALCPAKKENTQCSRLSEKKSGKVTYRFEWSTHCHACELREKCVGAGQKHRSLVAGVHHNSPRRARRREQRSEVFLTRMKTRNGIEATQSELVRAHGLRQAGYRGKAKVDLQNQLIGAACNIKRWLRLMAWEMKQSLPPGLPASDGGLKPAFCA